jgi:hypothetical protein
MCLAIPGQARRRRSTVDSSSVRPSPVRSVALSRPRRRERPPATAAAV